jgi:signal transduction histidine kinase
VSYLDPGAALARLVAASARIRAATRADDVLDLVAEEARALGGAAHAFAARVELGAIVSTRSTSDESATDEPQPAAPSPPLAALLASARPLARADGFLAIAMPGSLGASEGLLAISRSASDDDAVLELALGQLATVGGLALESARLRARVESVTKAREVLLASVSHDLRNPLNTFAMSAGLLRDDLERNDVDCARGISLVSRMERATSRMQGLIEDLVEASRIDARKIELVVREEKATQLVKEAAMLAKPPSAERSASVACESSEDDPVVLADRARTLQAIAKVIAFATKATGDGGAIRLGVARHGDAVVFTARAFGPGGAPVPPPEEGRGGLSLLIARGIVEAQRGTFRVEAGDALVVVFTLPAKA